MKKINKPFLNNIILFFSGTIGRKMFFGFLFSSIIPLIIGGIIVIKLTNKMSAESALIEANNAVELYTVDIEKNISNFEEDVFLLSKVPPIQGIARARNTAGFDELDDSSYVQWIDRLADIFEETMIARGDYSQLRYIDEHGNEIVRVDFNNGKIDRVPKEKLQNKSNRYYFKDTVSLNEGELFVSPLDLNREGKLAQIEVPHNPVIRYGTPVMDNNGVNIGMVMINVSADSIFKTFKERATGDDKNKFDEDDFLIDKDGYYLFSTVESDRWGSDRDLGTGVSAYDKFPIEIMENMLSNDFGAESMLDGSVVAYRKVKSELGEVGWVVIRVEENEIIFARALRLRTSLYFLLVSVVIFAGFVSWILSKIITKPIKILERGAGLIEAGNLDISISTKSADEIGELSRTFEKMLISIRDYRDNLNKKVEAQTSDLRLKTGKLESQRVAILNIMDDVEEGRRISDVQSKKLNEILETLPVGVVILSRMGKKVDFINSVAHDLFRINVGHVDKLNIYKEDGSPYLRKDTPMSVTFETKERSEKSDIFVKDSNDEMIALSVVSSPILDSSGNIENVIVVLIDITKAHQVDKAKSEFVSLASHQLRTPLSAIGWYTDMLLAGDAGKLQEKQVTFLNEIKEGNRRMVDLVNALLNVSRLELGTFTVEPEKLDIREIAMESIKELEPMIREKSIILTHKFDEMPLMNLDKNLSKILLDNILSNAVKYTNKGGTVDVTIKKDNKLMLIAVKDSGMGIPKEQQENIFGKFFRADNVKKADTEGTGLGLYMVASILKQSGGKVWFESVENKGTTFFITLPLTGMVKKEGTRKLT